MTCSCCDKISSVLINCPECVNVLCKPCIACNKNPYCDNCWGTIPKSAANSWRRNFYREVVFKSKDNDKSVKPTIVKRGPMDRFIVKNNKKRRKK